MTKILLFLTLLFPAATAWAGPASGGVKVMGGGSSGATPGQDFNGDDGVFRTLSSTGTAPSLTATGAVVKGSFTVLGTGTEAIVSVGGASGYGQIVTPAGATALYVGTNNGGGTTFIRGGSDAAAIDAGASDVVVNQSGLDRDFRVEGDTDPNLIFADASADKVGIGTASPGSKLEVKDGSATIVGTGAKLGVGTREVAAGRGQQASDYLLIGSPTFAETSRGNIRFSNAGWGVPSNIETESNGDKLVFWNNSNYKVAIGQDTNAAMWFQSNGSLNPGFIWYTGAVATPLEKMRLDVNGNLGIGTSAPATKLDVAGDARFGSGVNKATVTAGGFWQPLSQTTLQASLLAPTAVGQYIDNSTIGELCRSTGTSAGNWARADDTTAGCF